MEKYGWSLGASYGIINKFSTNGVVHLLAKRCTILNFSSVVSNQQDKFFLSNKNISVHSRQHNYIPQS